MLHHISLQKDAWQFDDAIPLGPAGGFGEVFLGSGKGGEVAVKRLKLDAGHAAYRELKIGAKLSDRTLKYIVPILDYGQDANSDRYFLVMPVCQNTLDRELKKVVQMDWADVKDIALSIVRGLLEANDIVHRDLKPSNILLHDSNWKIADFGIAKFVQDSTSLETLRRALTPEYGAPEQWNSEAPKKETDVYALGCIIHTLSNGTPPFSGENLREQHLTAPPPALPNVPPAVASLVSAMLRKSPELRPTLQRCKAVFEATQSEVSGPGSRALASVAKDISEQMSKEEADRHAYQLKQNVWNSLAHEGIAEIKAIIRRLKDNILSFSEVAKEEMGAVKIGEAQLGTLVPIALPFHNSEFNFGSYDIAAYSAVRLASGGPPHKIGFYVFSATWIFARTADDANYRWREISFWSLTHHSQFTPFQLLPDDDNFRTAFLGGISNWNVAYGPWSIDSEDEESFRNRWLHLIAKAASGKLRQPSYMPISETYFQP